MSHLLPVSPLRSAQPPLAGRLLCVHRAGADGVHRRLPLPAARAARAHRLAALCGVRAGGHRHRLRLRLDLAGGRLPRTRVGRWGQMYRAVQGVLLLAHLNGSSLRMDVCISSKKQSPPAAVQLVRVIAEAVLMGSRYNLCTYSRSAPPPVLHRLQVQAGAGDCGGLHHRPRHQHHRGGECVLCTLCSLLTLRMQPRAAAPRPRCP